MPRSLPWGVVLGGICLLGSFASSTDLSAQNLPLKLPAAASFSCPESPRTTGAPVVSPAVIDSVFQAGSRASQRGDHEQARLLLRQASFLDPSNPVVAFWLGGTLEALGDTEGAIAEYCRQIALSPEDANLAEVELRIRALASRESGDSQWRSASEDGVTAFRAGRFNEAVTAFNRAVTLREELPESRYNRGVSRIAAGARLAGGADLYDYLVMFPDAEDASQVRSWLEAMPEREQILAVRLPLPPTDLSRIGDEVSAGGPPAPTGVLSGTTSVLTEAEAQPLLSPATPFPTDPIITPPAPGSVLLRGLLIPGLGQLTTGRPVFGVIALAAAGGAAYYGFRETTVTRRFTVTDPFGNTSYEYDDQVTERPHQLLGFAAAGGISVISALEAYFDVRGNSPRLSVVPAGQGATVLSLSFSTR
ncbi:MAG: tetratricopeptide repeat protein [Gemmatimonadota bacterium]|nr:tetratricopeptide repeat protein [Gemmatimonadota bacterium]